MLLHGLPLYLATIISQEEKVLGSPHSLWKAKGLQYIATCPASTVSFYKARSTHFPSLMTLQAERGAFYQYLLIEDMFTFHT